MSFKQLVDFCQNVVLFCNAISYKYFCVKLIHYNEYLVTTVDADNFVLYDQSISNHSTEHAPMFLQLFRGLTCKYRNMD